MSSKPTSQEKFLNASLITGKERVRISQKQTTGQMLWENFATDFTGFLKWIGTLFVTAKSITGKGTTGSPIQLVNDEQSPPAGYYYGTDANGVKKWIANQSTGFPYKSYVALLSQTGTNAPVATLVDPVAAALFGTVTWGYLGVGVYSCDFPDIVAPQNKIVVFTNTGVNMSSCVTGGSGGDNGIAINSVINTAGSYFQADDILDHAPIEIRVYQ